MPHSPLELAHALAVSNDPAAIASTIRAARELATGEMRRVADTPASADANLSALTADLSSQPVEARHKWADALVYVNLMLGMAELPLPLPFQFQAFESAVRFVRSMVQTRAGRCPPHASDLAVAIVESVLCFPLCEHDHPLQCELLRARELFEAWGPHGRLTRRMNDLYESMLRFIRQRTWKISVELRDRFTILLSFHCPLGDTHLAVTLADPATIEFTTFDPYPTRAIPLARAKAELSLGHPGIQVHEDQGLGGVRLTSTLRVGDGPLHSGEFIKSITLINAAAETLLGLA